MHVIARAVCLLAVAGAAFGDARRSAERAIALFEKAGTAWKVPCASCHHQAMAMLALDSARRHGIAVNEAAAQAHVAKTLRPYLTSVDAVLAMPLDAFAMGYSMAAAHTAGVRPNLVTSVLARRFLNAQLADGRWTANDGRPPLSSSEFTATALAVRAIRLYAPAQLAAERDRSFDLARRWLKSTAPRSSEDASYRLLGLLWACAPPEDRRAAAKALVASQREDGGWAQEPGMESDAYATGQALYALRQSRVLGASSEIFRRGLRFLLDTQREDGSWLVKTRLRSPAQISPPFFDSGFPHGPDQYASFSATAWAVMGMLEALPEVTNAVKPEPPAGAEPKDAEPWMETALFGSVDDLKKLLDGSLDPNILPYVAPDAAKVELLLARGAKPDARALATAASFRGSAPTLRLLIAAGGKAGSDLLRAAATAGDAEAAALLIAHGADPNARSARGETALAAAVMMNQPEVVRVLVRAGAEIDAPVEDTMTPLIMSALLHRTPMVRLLLELGADPNVVDRFGYTALRHTEDIAFADPKTAAVLRAVTATR